MNEERPIGEMETDEIIGVLRERCPALVVAACVPDDGDSVDMRVWVSGNQAACLGLADFARERMRESLRDQAHGEAE